MHSPPIPADNKAAHKSISTSALLVFFLLLFSILVLLVSWLELWLVFEVMIGLDLRSSPSTLELCWTVNNSYWMTNHFEMIKVNQSLTIKQESLEVFDASDFLITSLFLIFIFQCLSPLAEQKSNCEFRHWSNFTSCCLQSCKKLERFLNMLRKKETQSHFLCYQA